ASATSAAIRTQCMAANVGAGAGRCQWRTTRRRPPAGRGRLPADEGRRTIRRSVPTVASVPVAVVLVATARAVTARPVVTMLAPVPAGVPAVVVVPAPAIVPVDRPRRHADRPEAGVRSRVVAAVTGTPGAVGRTPPVL